MFRPWTYNPQPEPQFPWAGPGQAFNNVHTGDRVNINTNNFNAFPRANPHPPFNLNAGPRLFNFANLFNTTNNFPNGPLRPDGRLRNRITVLLPDGTRILVDRDVMHEHLPRTRNAVPGAYFAVPEFLRGYNPGLDPAGFDRHRFQDAFARAAGFVFRYIEMLCRSNREASDGFDLFARPRFLLLNARNRLDTIQEIYWHLFLLCCVLDQDRAFGCSDMFARPIGEFLVEFMPRVEAFMPPGAAQLLFVGYARIFRETRVEIGFLRELWEMMDDIDQMRLRETIGPQLAGNGMGNNAHRIWTALRHLGLV
ncbi:hypothetical protein CkaCkLH20_02060 [Colletotrichum karsti]|uniref:Uncharacterized protein n=1 Tax=Colletotrichum karsti TaxID=1095194 RepID=A0A9P6IDY5_9PEZI|nr:uncharacterized protein CkaCkLH20_02060 [Colletotrichum karsti]KAF9880106.1 hypothetical protein CkaCkLH20_02060 [Colletotrichum karsti]